MKTIDWSKADAWIDSYLAHITDENNIPGRFGRTWLELEAEKVGLVQDGRGWEFGESHAAWYAALIRTGRLRAVNRVEIRVLNRDQRDKPTTQKTINKLRGGRMRDTVTARMLETMLETASRYLPRGAK